MADMLNKNEKHLFLEQVTNSSNSFIANVNKLANKIENLIELNVKLTPEQIDILTTLANIGAATLAEDLEKGSESGYRKLDIDLLKNFYAYSKSMSDDEKRELWATVDAQVYYESVTVTFKDKTSIHKTFQTGGVDTVVRNHHQLYDQLNNWPEFKAKYGYTLFNIAPDTALHNHELLRFIDGQGTGSNIDNIILHVASQGQNLNYDAAFQGAKENDVKYTWVNTTSVLLTICNDLRSLVVLGNKVQDMAVLHEYLPELTRIHASLNELVDNSDSIYTSMGIIKRISDNLSEILRAAVLLDKITELQQHIETTKGEIETLTNTAKTEVQEIVNEAKTAATDANEAFRKTSTKADSILNLTAHAVTLPDTESATASYDSDTGTLEFGIPKGTTGSTPEYEWVGTAIRFRNPDGTWGNFVDLKADVQLSQELQDRLTQIENRLSALEQQ